LYKSYKKRTFWFLGATGGVLVLGVGIVGFYVLTHLKNSLILHPEKWFPMIKPLLTLPQAIIDFLSCVPISAAGMELGRNYIMLALIMFALAFALMRRKEFAIALPLCISFALLMIVYVCAYAGDDPFSKLISAAWYKNGFRVSAAIPIIVIPLFCIVATLLLPTIATHFQTWFAQINALIKRAIPNNFAKRIVGFALATVLLAVVILTNPIGHGMRAEIEKGISFTHNSWTTALITQEKMVAFEQIRQITPDDALILADPFNGSAFLYSLYGRRVIFPTLNPRLEKGSPLRNVLNGFKKGDITPICAYAKTYNQQHFGKDYASPVYFLSLGPSYTIDDPIYKQYDPLHDEESIVKLVKSGKMSQVAALANRKPLRIFNCE
jgi:hypothetical protein